MSQNGVVLAAIDVKLKSIVDIMISAVIQTKDFFIFVNWILQFSIKILCIINRISQKQFICVKVLINSNVILV